MFFFNCFFFLIEWVKNAWEKDFTDIDPLSLELENDLGENDYHIETLHKVCSVFDTWIHEKKGSREEGMGTTGKIKCHITITFYELVIGDGQLGL